MKSFVNKNFILKKLPAPSVTVSVDAMGGDHGPRPIIGGISRFLRKRRDVHFLLHGDPEKLAEALEKKPLVSRAVTVVPAKKTIEMTARPSQAMRNARETSMASALDSVKDGTASVCLSCGNTGALMAVSMLRLRKIEGINRPAIACLWPSLKPKKWNILLDVGADVTADANDLLQYSLMGAAYAKSGLQLEHPRIGLLNVGSEEHKGHSVLQQANSLLKKTSETGIFDYVGFVEGTDIPSEKIDVIVTDGFTGNVALKSSEGTARLIRKYMIKAFKNSTFSRFAALLAFNSLRELSNNIDPRRVNGGVFLGLNGTVVKSHGSADAKAIEAAIELAVRLGKDNLTQEIANTSADELNKQHKAQISSITG